MEIRASSESVSDMNDTVGIAVTANPVCLSENSWNNYVTISHRHFKTVTLLETRWVSFVGSDFAGSVPSQLNCWTFNVHLNPVHIQREEEEDLHTAEQHGVNCNMEICT